MTTKRLYRTVGAMMAAALVLGMTACSSENDLAGEPKTVEEPTAQTQATVIRVTVGAGISDPTPSPSPAWEGRAAWYTLDGRKLQAQPTKSGLYIHGGRKVAIK